MTSTVQIEPLYISAAASRNNASASRTLDGLVAFASGHLVSLWNSAVGTAFLSSLSAIRADLGRLHGRMKRIKEFTLLLRDMEQKFQLSNSQTSINKLSSLEMRQVVQNYGDRNQSLPTAR